MDDKATNGTGEWRRQTTAEEALQDTPKGTWALVLMAAALFFAAWLGMYFGLFMPRQVIG